MSLDPSPAASPDPSPAASAAASTAASAAQRRWRRTPLRTTLVASLMLLVTLALAASGLVAAATLRGYLVDRVDDRLRSLAPALAEGGVESLDGLPAQPPEPPDPDDGRDEGRDDGRGGDGRDGARGEELPSAYVVAITDASGAIVAGPTSNLLDPSEPLPDLERATDGGLDPDGELSSVEAERGDDEWRLLAIPVTLDDGSEGTLLIAQGLGDVDGTVTRLLGLFALIGAIAVLVLAVVGQWLVKRNLRPLDEVEHTAALIAAGDLTQRLPDRDPRTEVGSLSASLNTMLGQIEQAFTERRASEAAAVASEAAAVASEAAAVASETRMRRFVADASHELRTPLTSIRGFAELSRHGGVDDPEARARMMRRIEDEATRMGRLVDDLLLLARMDQQRPLEQSPVDLLVIAADAVHDASASAPDRAIDLQVTGTDPPAVVTGDDARLRQVVGNLVSNALGHTPTGSPVTVRVGTVSLGAGHEVVLEVVDHGPGMTSEQAERAFERFYRADESRHRGDGAAGGSGLGLAIVSALVAGHDGRVELDTEPGRGCTVRVRLPVRAG